MATNNTTKQFLQIIRESVLADAYQSGILPSLTAAQAVLESSNGNSSLSKSANNIFGIKGDYNGNYVTMRTKEWNKEKGYYEIYAKFKKYPSVRECIADHSAIFNKYDRYKNLRGLKDWKLACKYVREDGYATDPNYTSKLENIININKLYEWDKVVEEALKNGSLDLGRDGGNPYLMPKDYVKFGSQGSYVKWVQYQLNMAGYSIVVDGVAGLLTIGAVLDYQGKHGLTQDGIVGPKTILALSEE